MTHPDPHTADIHDRNQAALAEATEAPPPDIADDPAAYLRWARMPPGQRPKAPTGPRPAVRSDPYVPQHLRRGGPGRPPAVKAPVDLEAERNRQLDALDAIIAAGQERP